MNGDNKDNSVLRMLENSLRDGALYGHWDARNGGGDEEAMLDPQGLLVCRGGEFPGCMGLLRALAARSRRRHRAAA